MVCTFSKWVEIVILPRHDAASVWQAFFEHMICRYSVPGRVRTDQGNEFKGAFKEGCRCWGI